MRKHWLEINGAVEIDVEHDEFLDEFYKWLESKDWSFAGVTKPQVEDNSTIHLEDTE